jgi:hypothetical protein
MSSPAIISLSHFRYVGLAFCARLRAGVHIVLAAVCSSWLPMSLPRVWLQRRTGLAESIWSVRVARQSHERLRLAAEQPLYLVAREEFGSD